MALENDIQDYADFILPAILLKRFDSIAKEVGDQYNFATKDERSAWIVYHLLKAYYEETESPPDKPGQAPPDRPAHERELYSALHNWATTFEALQRMNNDPQTFTAGSSAKAFQELAQRSLTDYENLLHAITDTPGNFTDTEK